MIYVIYHFIKKKIVISLNFLPFLCIEVVDRLGIKKNKLKFNNNTVAVSLCRIY